MVRSIARCLFACALPAWAIAQPIDRVTFTELGRFQHPYTAGAVSNSTFSARIDRLDRPYVYMACRAAGLITLDISDPASPVPIDTIPVADLGGLDVNNVEQYGGLLVLALGGFEGSAQHAGMATVDVGTPAAPVVLGVWDGGPAFPHGCAITLLHGGRAYLGAMRSGLVVLDASDPADLRFLSSYQPDPSWPGIANYPPNARGMDIVGDVLYLAYDAGGLRTIGISDPTAPTELGRYINPAQPPNTPPAYNNVLVRGGLAQVATDFCGLEVVDVTDPVNMSRSAWLNPWNCNGFSWFGSDGHMNELATALGDSLLFVSAGDSEVMVYDITAPTSPRLVGGHILPNDTAAAWGMDVHGDLVVACFLNNAFLPLQPFYSKFGGLVLFRWEVSSTTGMEPPRPWGTVGLTVRPNPVSGAFDAVLSPAVEGPCEWSVLDGTGRLVERGTTPDGRAMRFDLGGRPAGIHLVRVLSPAGIATARLVLLGE